MTWHRFALSDSFPSTALNTALKIYNQEVDIRAALKEQFHAGLAMLADCAEKCPDDLWSEARSDRDGERVIFRDFWRIAFHTVYFTHLYLGQNEDAFQPWPDRRPGEEGMWQKPWDLEPFELPGGTEPYSRQDTLNYIAWLRTIIDPTIDSLDLDSEQTGFPWYRNMTKLSHELMTLRHLQGHVGQLSELLMLRGIDTDWISRSHSLR